MPDLHLHMPAKTHAANGVNTPFAASQPGAVQGKLLTPVLTAGDRFEPRFSGANPPSFENPGTLKRLWIRLLSLLDKVFGNNMEHIQRTVEHVGTTDRLELRRAGTNSIEAVDRETGKTLARIEHPKNSPNEVELYLGKGGFTAIVTSPDGTKYFGLGKSRVELGEEGRKTVVETLGEAIESNPAKGTTGVNRDYHQQQTTPQAMILGAGLATRFEPVSGEHTLRSKPDVFLNGDQTVIQNIANVLAKSGFGKVFVNTFFMPASLKESLNRSDADSVTFIDETAPSGTAGGLRKLLQNPKHYGFDKSKPILIVQGDAVTDVDLAKLMDAHTRNNALVTIGCQYVEKKDVDKFGIVVTDQSDEDGVSGKIASFQEKPSQAEAKSQLANTGFYLFSPEAFPLLLEAYENLPADKRDKELDFAKNVFPVVLEKAAQNGGVFWAQQMDGYWSDIGNPTQYLETVYDVFDGKVNLPLPDEKNLYLENGVLYWPGAREAAKREGAALSGNVIAALPYIPE